MGLMTLEQLGDLRDDLIETLVKREHLPEDDFVVSTTTKSEQSLACQRFIPLNCYFLHLPLDSSLVGWRGYMHVDASLSVLVETV